MDQLNLTPGKAKFTPGEDQFERKMAKGYREGHQGSTVWLVLEAGTRYVTLARWVRTESGVKRVERQALREGLLVGDGGWQEASADEVAAEVERQQREVAAP